MADNVPITAGSGTNVATDDVAGVHFQRVKLVDGTLDSSTAIPGDATNGLDVDVTRVQGSVTVAQATAANLLATVTAGSGFPGVATDGSAIISTGTLSMGTDGTNAQTIRVTTAGEPYVFIGGDNGAGGFQTASFDATLTDGESNAVSHLNVHSRGAVFNGTTWDRVRGDTTNGMDVDVTRVSGNVTVVQATGSNLNAVVSGTVTANLAAGTNNIGDVDVLTVPAPLNLTGGGLEASALRVTIANDSTGVLSVDDNGSTLSVDDGGGSLTVDGTVTVTQGTAANLLATVTAGSGFIQPATAGSTALTAGPQLMGSDGTLTRAVQTTTGGVLKVDGSATTQPVSGTVTVSQATAGNLNATVTGTVTAAQATAANLNATVVQGTSSNLRAQVDLRDGSGNAITSASRGATERALSVQILDGAGAQITSFGGGTQYVEDNASAGGETGTVMLGVRNDAAAAKTSADGDYSAFATDSAGRIGIADLGGSITVDGTVTANAGTGSFTVAQATAANLNATVTGTVTVTQATASSLNAQAVGTIAHASADSGNPVKIGARARTTVITSAATDNRTDAIGTIQGYLVTYPYALPQSSLTGTASTTAATDTAVIAAQGAGITINVTTITVYNDSTTNTFVNVKDGATTRLVIPAPAKGGATITLPSPLRLTANTALNFASATAVSTMYCSAVGFAGI